MFSYKTIHSSVPILQAQSLSGKPLNFLKRDRKFTPKRSPFVKGNIKMPRLAIRGIRKVVCFGVGFFCLLIKVLDIEQLLYLGFQGLHNAHYSKASIFTRTSQFERFLWNCTLCLVLVWVSGQGWSDALALLQRQHKNVG